MAKSDQASAAQPQQPRRLCSGAPRGWWHVPCGKVLLDRQRWPGEPEDATAPHGKQGKAGGQPGHSNQPASSAAFGSQRFCEIVTKYATKSRTPKQVEWLPSEMSSPKFQKRQTGCPCRASTPRSDTSRPSPGTTSPSSPRRHLRNRHADLYEADPMQPRAPHFSNCSLVFCLFS